MKHREFHVRIEQSRGDTLGPQQVVLISKTHTSNTENCMVRLKNQEGTGRGRFRRYPVLSNEKRVSYTGPSAHTSNTQGCTVGQEGVALEGSQC